MTISERQSNILRSIVAEYIKTAQPISSQTLEQRYDFKVSPATLRNEMVALSRKGFLIKPFASSGRVPTDKGYRFFVDKILEDSKDDIDNAKSFDDAIFPWRLAKDLASLSSSLVAVYLSEQDIFWKEGWEDLLQEPEFESQNSIRSFSRLIEDFEKNILTFPFSREIQVLIGREIPFSKVRDFSIMATECDFAGTEKGIVAFLGPKRMEYPKNIQILHTWKKQLKN